MFKTQPQIGRGHAAASALRPFDQADCVVVEVFIKARIEKLLW